VKQDAEPPEATEPPEPSEPSQPEQAKVEDAVEAAPASTRPRRRLTWGLLVPVVMGAAGLMFAMSFQAAQGRDLRADRDLPQLIMEGDARVAEKASALDGLQKEV
jgi:hypothetical protein